MNSLNGPRSSTQKTWWCSKDAPADLQTAVINNAWLTCASAASHYGLWIRNPPTQLHLACNHGHGSGFVRHRTVRFDAEGLLPLAAVEDAVIHALTCLPIPASTALATSAIRLCGVPLELLTQELKGSRSAPALQQLRELDMRAESIVEVDVMHLLRLHGISFEAQVQLPGIGRVDFLINGFLILEVDGFQFHSSRQSMRKDLQRNNASTSHGFRVLRYMPEDIWARPTEVIAQIQQVLRAQGR